MARWILIFGTPGDWVRLSGIAVGVATGVMVTPLLVAVDELIKNAPSAQLQDRYGEQTGTIPTLALVGALAILIPAFLLVAMATS